ncbi:efflux RND transporter periplasmic adaptor subunit [bacterium]|nr:efflux RND transporter periplasmic adaptor subunit [bacterium]
MKLSWTAAILVIILSIIFSSCTKEKENEKPPVPVNVKAVEEFKTGSGVRYSANIEADRKVDLAFKVSGYIESICQVRDPNGKLRDIQAGDSVKKNIVLARVRQSEYRAQVELAKASLAEAEAGKEQADRDIERARHLYESKSMTKADYDAADANAKASTARVEAAKAKLRDEEIAYADTEIKAPLDAVVLSRHIEAGELVSPGTPAFTMVDMTRVKAVFGIPDVMISHFKVGDELTVTAEAVPRVNFRGKITSISPSADAKTRLFESELLIPNPQSLLKDGMIATVVAADAMAPKTAYVVPLTSIVRSQDKTDQYAVFILEQSGGKQVARRRNVTLGEAFGNTIAVEEGVRAGEFVIVNGASLLEDGDKVSIVPGL